jgi:hypothetical protein
MITLTIDGEEIPLPDFNDHSPITLTWEGPPSYRAGDILVNGNGQPLGVLMHSTDGKPRGHSIIGDLYVQASGHWELRDSPAPWPFPRLDYLSATSLNLGTVEYGP